MIFSLIQTCPAAYSKWGQLYNPVQKHTMCDSKYGKKVTGVSTVLFKSTYVNIEY